MKKSVFGFFVMLIAVLSASVSAFALTDGDWEFQLLDDQVQLTKYLGEGGDVIMPDTVFGVPVTSVGDKIFGGEFGDKSSIETLKVSSGVKELPTYALNKAKNLTEVYLPEGFETVGYAAFRNCTSLESINLPEGLKEIKAYAFHACTSLETVQLPTSLEIMGERVFYDSGIEYIDMSKCTNLTKVGYDMFLGCNLLTEAVLPENMQTLPESFFRDCTNLGGVEIPATVTVIGRYAFNGCTSIDNIIIPTSVKEIRSSAFAGCTGLTEVVIPYGVEKIEGWVFQGNENLRSLYIPETVTSISYNLINDCKNCIIYCSQDSKTAEVCKQYKISYLTDKSVNSAITVLYNGTRVSFHSYGQNPELINSRTLVPLRSIFEAMGAEVEWQGETSTVVATRNGVTVTLQIGSSNMSVGSKTVTMDTPPMLLDGRTMVPVRVIAEAFGADVQWNSGGKTVIITE